MSILTTIKNALFGNNTLGGFDSVMVDLFEREEVDEAVRTVGVLTTDGVDRIVNEGTFDSRVEIGLSFDIGEYGDVPYTFDMPESPADAQEEINQFAERFGYDGYRDLFTAVANGGVELEFVRAGGEWVANEE